MGTLSVLAVFILFFTIKVNLGEKLSRTVTGSGVAFTYIGSGPHSSSLPVLHLQVRKPELPSISVPPLDTSIIDKHMGKMERAGMTVTNEKATLSNIKSAYQRISSLVVSLDLDKKDKRTRRKKSLTSKDLHMLSHCKNNLKSLLCRKVRSLGLLGIVKNIFFGSDDNSGEKRAIQDLKSSILSTNKAVAAQSKRITLLKDLEKSDVQSLSNQTETYHKQFQKAVLEYNRAISNLTSEIASLNDHIILLSMIQTLLSSVTNLEAAGTQLVSSMESYKIKLEALRRDAAAKALSPDIISAKTLQSGLDSLQGLLNERLPGIAIKYTGLDHLSYYYSSRNIRVREDEEYYYFSIDVPVSMESSSINWFQVTVWPIHVGNRSSGVCLLDLPDCVGRLTIGGDKAAMVDCWRLRTEGGLTSMVSPAPLITTKTTKCIEALFSNSKKDLEENCHYGICQVDEIRPVQSVGSNRYLFHGSSQIQQRCGVRNDEKQQCEDCIVSPKCYCYFESETGRTPVSFSDCGDKSQISFALPHVLFKELPSQTKVITPEDELSNRPNFVLPKKTDIKKDTPDIARRRVVHLDYNKAMEAMKKNTKVHLMDSDQNADKAVIDSDYSSISNSVFDGVTIVLFLWCGGLTATMVFIICKLPLAASTGPLNHTFNLIVHNNPENDSLRTEHIIYISLTSFGALLGIVSAIIAMVRKYRSRDRSEVAPEPEEGSPSTVLFLGNPCVAARLPQGPKVGHIENVQVKGNSVELGGKKYAIPLKDGLYEVHSVSKGTRETEM